jgi:hypothetical protein
MPIPALSPFFSGQPRLRPCVFRPCHLGLAGPRNLNDFGGTVGGPVWMPKIYEQRNKTFFFVSEEARRIVTYSNPPTATVPYSE